MKGFFLILMGVVILAGAGVGYFFFMDKSVAASSAEKHIAKDAHKAAGHGEEMAQPLFVELNALILPIINHNGVTQTISVVATIEVDNQADADKVTMSKPRLADAFLRDMYGSLSRQASLQGGLVKVDTLKKRLNKVSQEVMGEGVVDDVLLQIVHQSKV